MADFRKGFAITKGHEGGIADDVDDAGGFTYMGITSRDWPNWEGWPIVKAAIAQYKNIDVANRVLAANGNLQTLVEKFYKTNYWDVNKLDLVSNQYLANELFDTGVNMGIGTAALFLQQSLNVLNNNQRLYPDIAEDGKVGPQTLTLTNRHPYPKDLFLALNIFQGARYFANAKKNPKQEKFMRAWLSRVSLYTWN